MTPTDTELERLAKAATPDAKWPEMVYVLPELRPTKFETMFRDRGFDLYHLALDDLWDALRELTRKPKVEGREWWLWKGGSYLDPDHARRVALEQGYVNPPLIHVREVLKP